MRLLLDTHTFLWFLPDDPRVSKRVTDMIIEPVNIIEVSPASYWEIAIKISIGKYSLSEPLSRFLEREIRTNQFHIINIEPKHVEILTSLPFHHRDPFDRMMIAQAMAEQLSILSNDNDFDAYNVTRIW